MFKEQWHFWLLFSLVFAIFLLLFVAVFQNVKTEHLVELKTEYHLVILDNGLAYYGKISNLQTPFPILTDIYYVQSNVDPKSNNVSNTLLKRGKEWHKPDQMIINAQHIVFFEPVNPKSRVFELIQELKNKQD
ncbi:MAG: hypothetical protein HUU50_19040 [Candidatus Brocadiae bacterium]|nr:hypothetical protein [Candidatus Brocadiia bacterium]